MNRAALLLLLAASTANAAETDPYYGWFHPPHDGTLALDAAIGHAIDLGLRDVNREPPASCRVAAVGAVSRLSSTAAWYWAGSTRFWRVDKSPHNRTEYDERFRIESTYRWAPLLPFGSLVPLDPTVRSGDILFGTDKLGHFFTNGLRYYQRWQRAVDAHEGDDAAAERAAIMTGVDEEKHFLGLDASGIFSFADLESNYRGLQFFRDLCEGDNAALKKDATGRWVLTRPFRIEQWVDPCWDEGYYPSFFTPSSADAVERAIASSCVRWKAPSIAERRASYEKRGCSGRNVDVLAELVKKGEAPDPSPFSIDAICSGAHARSALRSSPTPSSGGR